MQKQIISTNNAPAAIGPYSQGVKVGNMLFLSGQTPVNPADGTLVTGDITAAARQVFENIKAVLSAAGARARPCFSRWASSHSAWTGEKRNTPAPAFMAFSMYPMFTLEWT